MILLPGKDNEIGKVIQKARLAKKMTQEKLSEITGVSLRTISNIENGKQHPRFDNLEKLGSNRHNAVKSMERDITDLRHYKKQIKEIATICDNTVTRIDALIDTIDNYRK